MGAYMGPLLITVIFAVIPLGLMTYFGIRAHDEHVELMAKCGLPCQACSGGREMFLLDKRFGPGNWHWNGTEHVVGRPAMQESA